MIPGPDMTVQPAPSSTTQNGLADNTTQPKTTTRPDEPPIPHSNPFDLIRDDLGFLASGHGLVLDERADGQEAQRTRMGGREWERLVGRLKGFLSDSNEKMFQVSPNDPTVQPKPTARKRARSIPPAQFHLSNLNGNTKRARTSSITTLTTGGMGREREEAKSGRSGEGYSVILPPGFRDKVLPGSASEIKVYDEAMWSTRQTLVDTVKHIQDGLNGWIRSEINPEVTAEETMNGVVMTNGSGPQGVQPPLADMQERGKKDGLKQQAVIKLLGAGGIELSVSDYWVGRSCQTSSINSISKTPSNSINRPLSSKDYLGSSSTRKMNSTSPIRGDVKMDEPGSTSSSAKNEDESERARSASSSSSSSPPEFGLWFRLPGVIRGFIVFGPRRRRRKWVADGGCVGEEGEGEGRVGARAGAGRNELGGQGGGNEHTPGDQIMNEENNKEDEEGKMMMLAIRFNVFADTELTKGKNDLSNYKTMVDLSRYLNLMELRLGETMYILSSYTDLMMTPCDKCGRLQGPTNGSLAFGRERVSSAGARWRAFHLGC